MKSYFTRGFTQKVLVGLILFNAIVVVFGSIAHFAVRTNILMSAIPLPVIALAIGVLSFLILVGFKKAVWTKIRLPIKVITPIAIGLYLYLELIIWEVLKQPNITLFYNPFAVSLSAVILFTFIVALLIYGRPSHSKPYASKPTFIISLTILAIGISMWAALSHKDILIETRNAKQKVELIGTMINETLDDQRKALNRMRVRLESLDDSDVDALIKLDINNYISDYDIIEGMVLYNERQEVLYSTAFGNAVIDSGFLNSPGTSQWLSSFSNEIRVAANARSMETSTPLIMVSVPVIREDYDERFHIVAFLNMNELVASDYLAYLSSVKTYMEFTPDTIISMQGESQNVNSLDDLTSQYHHYITASFTIQNTIEHRFHSFLVDYRLLNNSAQFGQFLLGLTGTFCFLFFLIADTTKRLARRTRQLYKMARFDDVTGLLRRDAFNRESEALNINCMGCYRAIVFLNLDGFNGVNDTFGQDFGDKLLRRTAHRIKDIAEHTEVITRYGNDEFILFYRDTTAHILKSEAKRILHAIREVFEIDGTQIHLTGSIGISVSGNAKLGLDTLVQQADIAMLEAKRTGGNQYCFFLTEMAEKQERLVSIRNKLQVALNENRLGVFYQPIYSSSTKQVVGVEALVRWQENGDFISPAEFIPIAEQTGQIISVGEQVLDKVLSDIHANPKLKSLSVSVNVSPQQLQRGNFASFVNSKLEKYGIAPNNLTLELTETVMSNDESIEDVLQNFRDQGFHIAIDDFGTGFSSLSYLARQPADIVKIDRAFTQGVEQTGKSRDLMQMTVEMCLNLDKTVVVEGVENEDVVEYLSTLGDLKLQGYYFSKPLPLQEMVQLL